MPRDKIYAKWNGMFRRIKDSVKKGRSHYSGVTISPEFHKFSDFREWAIKQIGVHNEGWQLDKDIIQRGNKVYCPELCIFVPRQINMLTPSSQGARGSLPIGVTREHKGKDSFTATCCVDGEQVKVFGFRDPIDAFHKYKEMKEANIKRLAEQYKAVIDPRAYAALMTYQVEITD